MKKTRDIHQTCFAKTRANTSARHKNAHTTDTRACMENRRLRAAERLHLQLTLAHAHGHYARLQSFELALSECVEFEPIRTAAEV